MNVNDFSPDQFPMNLLKAQLMRRYALSEAAKISLLKFSENITYLVEDKENYVLRLNRPGYHDKAELEDELIWIDHLKRETDLKIAGVIRGRDGNRIQTLYFPDSYQSCYSSLSAFLPGKTLRRVEGTELLHYMSCIGAITARLHNHTVAWEGSGNLKRFVWDYEALLGLNARWGHFNRMDTLPASQKKILGEAANLIKVRLQHYGKYKSNYGLIHSDLNINNILVAGESIAVLDFDDCGYGWFLYDLSSSVLEYFEDSQAASLRDVIHAWLAGYQKYRKLDRADYKEIDTFILLRKIVRIGWIATHSANDTVKKVDGEYYDKVVQMAEGYCSKYRKEVLL